LKTKEGNNIPVHSYGRIRFIPETFILSSYLNQKQQEKMNTPLLLKFSHSLFNLSQKNRMSEAFSNPLSVIEELLGTGKAQTILIL